MNLKPISLLAISLVAGILLQEYTAGLDLVITLIVLSIPVIFFIFFKQYILLAFLTAGFLLNMFAHYGMQNSQLLDLASSEGTIEITGAVREIPEFKYSRTKFSLDADKVKSSKKTIALNENVLVTLEGQADFAMGDRLSISGQIKKPPDNQKNYLYHKHISAIVITSKEDIKKLKTTSLLVKLSKLATNNIDKAVRSSSASKDTAGLLIGMTLGNTNGMSTELQDSFRDNGLFHLVAVSGTNIGLIILFMVVILKSLGVTKRVQALIILPFLVVYSFATGLSASVLRASIMATILVFSWILRIKTDGISALFASLLLLVSIDTFLIYDIGFQLSFGATLGLFLFYEKFRSLSILPAGTIGDGAALTISAQILILPLLAYYFNQLSIVSVFSNMATMPMVVPIINLAALSGIFVNIIPFLSKILMEMAVLVTDLLIFISYGFSSLNWSVVDIDSPSPFQLIAFYLFLLSLIFQPQFYKRLYEKIVSTFNPQIAFFIILVAATVYIWLPAQLWADKYLKTVYFDVGQADSSLLKSPEGATILVDGGSRDGPILRLLRKEHIARINLLIISHFEEDHAGGIVNVLKKYPVDYVLFSNAGSKKALFKEIAHHMKTANIDHSLAHRGQKWHLKDLSVDIISPENNTDIQDLPNNDGSLVARISYGKISFLYTGDIESTGQESLLEGDVSVKSSFLKVPHHGSADSANARFLEKVSPEVAVISVGRNNSYGHPSKKELKCLLRHKIKIHRTDKEGSVYVYSDKNTYRIETETQ